MSSAQQPEKPQKARKMIHLGQKARADSNLGSKERVSSSWRWKEIFWEKIFYNGILRCLFVTVTRQVIFEKSNVMIFLVLKFCETSKIACYKISFDLGMPLFTFTIVQKGDGSSNPCSKRTAEFVTAGVKGLLKNVKKNARLEKRGIP